MSGMTIRHQISTILAAGAATLLLVACGGSSGDDPLAGKPDDAKQLAFVKCMRKAGVEVADAKAGPTTQRREGRGAGPAVSGPKGINPDKMMKIDRDCRRKTGGGPRPPSKEEQAKFLDQALKFARCMRQHGIPMGDPQVRDGGMMVQKVGGPDGPNPGAPAFERAQRACAAFQPKGQKGGPPPGAGPGKGKSGATFQTSP
jgi:hypothetical protein